jgi:hypothetical protein
MSPNIIEEDVHDTPSVFIPENQLPRSPGEDPCDGFRDTNGFVVFPSSVTAIARDEVLTRRIALVRKTAYTHFEAFGYLREIAVLVTDQQQEIITSTIKEHTESPHLCQYQFVQELVLKRCPSTIGPEELRISAP